MIQRYLYLNRVEDLIDSDFVKVIVGIRRCGKTTFLRNIIQKLEERNVNPNNIIYISLESLKYSHITDYLQLNDLIIEKTRNLKGKVYLFFDEIQLVSSWERSINSFRVSLDSDIYITGSNSKLLSGELSTLLSGRYARIELYPFSFKEVLQYNEEINNVDLDSRNIRELFDEYFEFGGMPGLLSINDELSKKGVLEDIYDSIIVRDILTRYNIKEIDLFKRFSYYLMNSTSQTFSKTSITGYLKNENKKTTRNTISNFTDYLQQSLFTHRVFREDILGKKLLKTEEKYYLTDHGFHTALIDSNKNWIPRILENIVYIELLRRGYKVKVGKIKNREIDFVCERYGKKVYIQVSYLLVDEKTIEREFGPLLDIPDKYDTYVLSMDEFNIERYGIKHMNIIDFLIGDEL